MYQDYYKLHTLPFENTPDPRFFFASEQHREALAAIEYTLRMRKGFVLVTGDIGSGKTTVARTMIDRCGDRHLIVQLLHGHNDGGELLRQMLRLLDLPVRRQEDHARQLERLRQKLLDQMQAQRPVVLMVDEAQTLSDDALEELRLLSNFDAADQKLIQMVLIGQPELRSHLRSARMAPLRQRITLAKQLRPLTHADTAAYIAHRLRAASVDPAAVAVKFISEAVLEIYRHTGGVPRLINVACDNCLLLGFVREIQQINANVVHRALEDMVPNLADSIRAEPTVQPAALVLAGSM